MVVSHKSYPILRHAAAILGLVFFAGSAMASEVVTLDFPLDAARVSSAQLAAPPRQLTRPDGIGYTEIYLNPVPDGESLMVTLVFNDAPNEGVSLFWIDAVTGKQSLLSQDLSDGVSGLNQRTIAVSSVMAANQGRLVISGKQTNVKRVRLDWAVRNEVLVSTDQKTPQFVSGDRVFQAEDLSGAHELGPPDTWFGDVLEASLQEEPVPLEGEVEFVVPIPSGVDMALLKARFLGLPLKESVEVFVNGVNIGALRPTVPGLSDPGYLTDANGETTYSGWREAALLVPVSSLKEGDNSVILKTSASTTYVRDTILQLKAHAIAPPTTDGVAIGETQDLAPR